MLIKIFTLRFDPRIEGFDDEILRAFMRDKDLKRVREHFFVKDETLNRQETFCRPSEEV